MRDRIASLTLLTVLAATAGARGGALTPSGPPSPGNSAAPGNADAFDKLVARWSLVTDYVVTIATFETLGEKSVRSVLAYSFRKPDRARLEVIQGNNRGAVLIWRGGTAVTAYKRGLFSAIKLDVDIHAKRINSLRGNGILSPNLGDVLDCFSAHRSNVRTVPGPPIDGEATDQIELSYSGFTCSDDSAADSGVTRDVLAVASRTSTVLRRERFAGETLVERYDLSDLKANAGLSDGVFR